MFALILAALTNLGPLRLLYSMPFPSPAPCSPVDLQQEGLSPAEYGRIVQRLGRHPNRTELGMFGVMWSEHCCYKNSRPC